MSNNNNNNLLQQSPLKRQLTGIVTKLVGDGATYGFINDEIFFQQAKIIQSNGPASVGDQVFAECEYSANLPIKWNATSVKILSKAGAQPRQEPNQGRLLPPTTINPGQQQQTGDRQQPPNMNTMPPMGPANFAFNNPMGAPFLPSANLGQFIQTPAPFLPQPGVVPPAHLLPSQPQQQQPLLPQNTNNNNSQNYQQQQQPQQQSQQRYNKSTNQQSGNDRRYGDNKANNNDNNRQQGGNRGNNNNNNNNNKNHNRQTDNNQSKYNDRSRSRDRDGSLTRHHQSSAHHQSSWTNKSNKDSVSREAKAKRGVQNIPKTTIVENINPQNIKVRGPSSLHVPSDLKEIIVNQHYRLDLRNIPKPINIVIDKPKPAAAAAAVPSNSETTNENKSSTNITTSSTTDEVTKLNHKYGVKVVLLSIPEMEAIYKHVFGPNLDSLSDDNSNKSITSDLDNMIQLLCNKGANNGYSLVGGKFDPSVDGFVEGVTNMFERGKRQPNLISTCKRVIMDQVNLDLSNCKNWTWLATFIYNNRTDYFSSKASIEYSYIYIPQLWTMKSEDFDRILLSTPTKGAMEVDEQHEEVKDKVDQKPSEEINEDTEQSSEVIKKESDEDTSKEVKDDIEQIPEVKSETIEQPEEAKVEESSEVEIEANDEAKVAISNNNETGTVDSGIADETKTKEAIIQCEDSQLSEGEVAASASASDNEGDIDHVTGSTKRKDGSSSPSKGEPSVKKSKLDSSSPRKTSNANSRRVELIREPFVVRPRDPEQQQLSLVSLHETYQPARYDQFELSMASNLLKEALIQHFSEYMLTTLVEDHRQQRKKDGSSGSSHGVSASSGASTSSQETIGGDTNNNSSTKSSSEFKNPSDNPSTTTTSSGNSTATADLLPANLTLPTTKQEYPIPRYLNLAFTYFDANHSGYLELDDLSKLFNNTKLTISRRALISLIGNDEKERCQYQFIADLSPKLPPTYVYKFPQQFNELPGSSLSLSTAAYNGSKSVDDAGQSPAKASAVNSMVSDSVVIGNTVHHKGETYDLEKLVNQVREAEALRVNLIDRFNNAIENYDKQAEEIHLLEVSRKSLGIAIKTQNEEISDLKKERDSIKKKLDNVRRGIKSSVSSLSDLIKNEEKSS